MEKEVKELLEKVRPSLQMDGGDVEFVSLDEKKGIVKVKLTGSCRHCPMSEITLKQGIESLLKEKIKGIKEVINVD